MKACIYKNVGFTRNTIPNDLILRMGFDSATSNLTEWNESVHISAKQMSQAIQNIFGKNMKFKHSNFYFVDEPVFYDYTAWQTLIEYYEQLNELGEVYVAYVTEGGGGAQPGIGENIQKILQYNNKIEVYVNPVFCDYPNGDEGPELIYRSFDFTKGEFVDEIKENSQIDYSEDKFIDLDEKIEFTYGNNVSNKLDTYVYTFELDSTDGEYYLSSFEKRS